MRRLVELPAFVSGQLQSYDARLAAYEAASESHKAEVLTYKGELQSLKAKLGSNETKLADAEANTENLRAQLQSALAKLGNHETKFENHREELLEVRFDSLRGQAEINHFLGDLVTQITYLVENLQVSNQQFNRSTERLSIQLAGVAAELIQQLTASNEQITSRITLLDRRVPLQVPWKPGDQELVADPPTSLSISQAALRK
jgi:chromosome segregation ATPase